MNPPTPGPASATVPLSDQGTSSPPFAHEVRAVNLNPTRRQAVLVGNPLVDPTLPLMTHDLAAAHVLADRAA